MPVRYGKCINFGLCPKADTKEIQSIPYGEDFLCGEPSCRKPLQILQTQRPASSAMMPILILGVLVLLGVGGFVAFRMMSAKSPGATPSGGTETRTTTPPPVSTGGNVVLTLSGSNTIGAELAPQLVQAFLRQKGASDVRTTPGANAEETRIIANMNGSPVVVEVKAHGSKTAFVDIGKGAADIGMASRRISPDEASNAKLQGLGDLTSNAAERVVGLDGIAVIVNSANSIDQLSKDDLAKIFSGEAGGRWTLHARDDKSGTFDTFKSLVLGSAPLSPNAKRYEDSKALVAAVAADPNAIGFVGLPYAVGVKKLAISERGTYPLSPNTITVRTESYPLTRRLYFYLPDGVKPMAREFATFALSDAGQELVEGAGFVGQKIATTDAKESLPGGATKDYADVVRGADRLTTDLRFRTGSADLDSKAVDDVDRIVRRLGDRSMAGRGIILIGFADNTGGRPANIKLSKERAESVGAAFRRQGLSAAVITGFGPDMPVADNSSPDGREKNRRVEVWLKK